jgi:hypothetical protein
MTRLASVWVTPAAPITFSTTMVLDTEIIDPNQSASLKGILTRSIPAVAAVAMVSRTWAVPPKSVTLRTMRRSRKETSRPSENSSSATPISASVSMSWIWTTVGPAVCGPTAIPAKT